MSETPSGGGQPPAVIDGTGVPGERNVSGSAPAVAPESRAPAVAPESRALVAEDVTRLYRLLIESLRDYAVFVLDPTGHILTWNPGAERIKGYAAHEIIGRHFSVFYTPEEQATDKPGHELRVASREGRFEDEGWRVRSDGGRLWANVIITALRAPDGALVGFAKFTRDLTERRAAHQRALEDAHRIAEAEAADRAKGEFLTAMSHELRTPLNAIGGYVDLLLAGVRGPLTPMQAVDIERIRRSQQHLLGIINDLLNFSRIGAGRIRYDIAAVRLIDLIDNVRVVIEPLAAGRALHVHWPLPDTTPIVLADPAKAEQILINVLMNAVKFTDAGGYVGVTWAKGEELIGVSVSDTGIGIPADKLESVFEPFVQIGRSHSSAHEGTGLGLAISRDLAHAMGGDLIVSSEPGIGSVFTLLLPRAARTA